MIDNPSPEVPARDAHPWGVEAAFTVSGSTEQQAALFAALSAAQGEFPDIPRTKTAKIFGETKAGKRYEYTFDYAPLDAILKAVRGPLKNAGLCLVFPPAAHGSNFSVGAMLSHSGGGRMQTTIHLERVDDIKKQAGNFTYMQRYCVCGLLGIFADTDDDGASANDERADIRDRSKPPVKRQEKKDQQAERPPNADHDAVREQGTVYTEAAKPTKPTPDQNRALAKLCTELGYHRQKEPAKGSIVVRCEEVTGVSPAKLDSHTAQQLIEALQEEALQRNDDRPLEGEDPTVAE